MAYHNILVPIDGSENSLNVIKPVIELAKIFNSKVTIVQVMTLDPYIAAEYMVSGPSNQLIERARNFIQANLNTAKEKFAAEGLDVETKLLEGESISRTIAKAIEELGSDLVVISSHGRSGFKKFIMGSVAQSLMTEIQTPILVIKQ
ncbi:universal stress protein [Acinetobacter silvestris]|uniref:Universal stress protein n=1 Tax=Acinetobacter silvestris TaxID=1977882 RepID=A0A1Y3CHB5_9GAMM|nr:universal stress protein [Acinetobacter silvestris]OTG65495.1 universal stress protein [Acinetobacter silvestris]